MAIAWGPGADLYEEARRRYPRSATRRAVFRRAARAAFAHPDAAGCPYARGAIAAATWRDGVAWAVANRRSATGATL